MSKNLDTGNDAEAFHKKVMQHDMTCNPQDHIRRWKFGVYYSESLRGFRTELPLISLVSPSSPN